jgi:WXG100 family type VII secretion target
MYLQGLPPDMEGLTEGGVTPVAKTRVTLEELRKTANTSREVAGDIRTTTSRMAGQLAAPLTQWKGEAPVAANAAWNELQTALGKLATALDAIGEQLATAEVAYGTTDQERASEIAKANQDLSMIPTALSG